ncbi:putative caffeine resistance protein [Mycena venus]|uniref:Putative caffeine resistance protein n=1 Tax=Mycena venus TaxID=2733690 RepID=A0A8H7D2T3_9AGAR|nr:putative caffeine resistance protein [Mycena venus]
MNGKIISEIVKIAVKPGFDLSSPGFAQLRKASVAGGVKEQYYGLSHEPEPERHLCWIIQWPETSGPLQTDSFRDALKQLDANRDPVSWLVPFADASQPRRALVAPCAQLCTVPLKPDTNIPTIANSLHKTYSDCYEAPGFTGGYWGTALNDKLINWYYLGWETRATHDAYAETPLFWVEINNLMPHMAGGWADYYNFVQQLD